MNQNAYNDLILMIEQVIDWMDGIVVLYGAYFILNVFLVIWVVNKIMKLYKRLI